MTRDDITAALSRYGASLDGENRIITSAGKQTGVTLTVKRGRLTATIPTTGYKLYTGPAIPASVGRFVESFWYWKPTV